ncbi:protein PIN-LIKES 6-like [Oryza brachyantha]|uniref:Auxin efflux carrier family protein n=1 Tax=Oryza brachyantha TaxID=4533 RepID=J3M883_ORYBR|nr:protein PIN-LIKES 6-like [Oryza brachyantha]
MVGRSALEMAAAQGGAAGESVLDMLRYAVLPIAKVFVVCFMGFLMASKRVGLLKPSGRKLLNGLVFSLLLPCLIFAQLGRAITFDKILQWWFIPVNIALGAASASLIGLIVALIVRPPYPYFKFTISHIGIGNIGNIPLVLISALCRDQLNPFGDSSRCTQDGNAYLSFGQWVGAIIIYTYVFKMLAPPPGMTFDSCDEEKEKLPLKAPNAMPGVEKYPSSAHDDTHEEEPLLYSEEEQDVPSLGSKIMIPIKCMVRFLQKRQLLQPPIIASVLAITLGAVPFLKNLILTDDAPLFFLTDGCLILGEAMIPCILLAVGGNLVDGPGEGSRRLGVRTTIAIIFARLVLVPIAGVGIVSFADKLGFIPKGDKMFKFVLLLQHSMPTSVLSGAVANLRGCGKESAAILFWVHIFAVFSMAGWIIFYLAMLF